MKLRWTDFEGEYFIDLENVQSTQFTRAVKKLFKNPRVERVVVKLDDATIEYTR